MKTRKTKPACSSPFPFHPLPRPIFNALAQPLLPALGMFAFVQENCLAAPALDPTRTEYALRITAPVIDGVVDPDEWKFAAGNSDYWHVFPDDKGFAADGIRGGELISGALPDNSDDLSFKIYAGFDDENLYVAV